MADPTTYISTSDITDSQLIETNLATLLSAKVTACDAALNDLAERKGVLSSMIETSPLHYVLKKWCVEWVCENLCFDLMGKNKTESLEQDIYFQKYKEHQKSREGLENTIDYAILTGTVITEADRPACTTRIYRG
jgi:hypothetical protein